MVVNGPDTVQPRANGRGAARPCGTARRVLIVEDNHDTAESLRLLLELLGHRARVAYTGPEGVRVAREWPPDVVVCDVGLPGLDGYAVARELRRCFAAAPPLLVAVTAYSGDEARRRARESGFDHFFTKPAEPRQLLDVIGLA
jgi:two-component system CheB/CheR fusion protein